MTTAFPLWTHPRLKTLSCWGAGVTLLAVSGLLYTYDLGQVPPRLGLDEAHFGIHAQALSSTGRDLNGNTWPLFVSLTDPLGDQPVLPWGQSWYQPFLFYLIALTLRVLPFAEASIRVPTALLGGVVNVALMYAVTWRLTGQRVAAAGGALLLAFCPTNVILSRQAVDFLCPLPFTLGWLWCLVSFARTPRLRFAAGAGLLLGAGCYTYVTSWVYMPLYLAMSWMVFWSHRAVRRSAIVASAVAFAVPLLMLVPWLMQHPGMLSNIAAQYQVREQPYASAFQGLASGEAPVHVMQRTLSTYWDYFNPSFLFIIGGSSRNVSTGRAGVFLFPIAVLLPVGMWTLLRRRDPTRLSLVLTVGVLSAPLLAALKGTPFSIQRAAQLLTFVTVISAVGLATIWEAPRRWAHAVVIALLAASTIQFAGFYSDYQSAYRMESGPSYDPTNFGETAAYLVESGAADGAPAIYLTAPLYDVSAKWRFYVTKYRRVDLLDRTHYFSGDIERLTGAVPGSLAVVVSGEPAAESGRQDPQWRLAHLAADAGGGERLAVLRRLD